MRDYHQWKTGVRVDGLFGPLGMIGTVIGFFTGYVYPTIYNKMGLFDDYDVLYNDSIRNNLFEVVILCSAAGALLNLIPFCFYNLTENKHKAYVDVLKIRAMFENHYLGKLEKEELKECMEVIHQAESLVGKEKVAIGKSADKAAKKQAKETNLAIERAKIILQDLKKFSTDAGKARLATAHADFARGCGYFYSDARADMKAAKKLPKKTPEEKEIRSDAIKNARVKKEAASLIRKYGADNITVPDESVKEEITNRETHGFFDSIRLKQELRAYLKKESIYTRVTKPYNDAKSLITQAEAYTHYDELERMYVSIQSD